MIETKEEYESITHLIHPALWETIEALRKAIAQVPKVIVLEHGTDICNFCRAHPVDDHYAHCAYVALPDWIKKG